MQKLYVTRLLEVRDQGKRNKGLEFKVFLGGIVECFLPQLTSPNRSRDTLLLARLARCSWKQAAQWSLTWRGRRLRSHRHSSPTWLLYSVCHMSYTEHLHQRTHPTSPVSTHQRKKKHYPQGCGLVGKHIPLQGGCVFLQGGNGELAT